MQPGEVRLSIDCGSVSAVAVLTWPDGRWSQVLFDGAPELPAAVFVGPDGDLLVGTGAWQRAAAAPERFVAAPMRRLGDGQIVLAASTVDTIDLVAAILRRVAEEAAAFARQPVRDVRLVIPAAWG